MFVLTVFPLHAFITESVKLMFFFPPGIYLQATSGRAPPFSGLPAEGLPARFDWRDKAVVAAVQDQLAVSLILIDVRSVDQLTEVMQVMKTLPPTLGGFCTRPLPEGQTRHREEAQLLKVLSRRFTLN